MRNIDEIRVTGYLKGYDNIHTLLPLFGVLSFAALSTNDPAAVKLPRLMSSCSHSSVQVILAVARSLWIH